MERRPPQEQRKKHDPTRVSLISILVLIVLIIANVFLAMPPRAAFSDTKKVVNADSGRAAPSTKQEDFGSETIDPVRSSGAQPLPIDLVEEPQGNPSPTPTPSSADSNVGANAGSDEDEDGDEDLSESEPDSDITTALSGNEIDVAALVKLFSKRTKRNYIVDNNVKGKVAIHVATPVSVEEGLRILESVLLLKGFTTVPLGNNTWKVITAKDAKQTTIPMLASASDQSSDALVTELIRLKNTQATELQQVLQQFVSKEGMINAFGATNALILIDSAANIKRLVQLVEQLDVPAVDQDITIIPIVHAEAKDIAEKINSILGEGEGADQSAANANRLRNPTIPPVLNRPGFPQTTSPSNPTGVATTAEKRELPLKLIPDDRTNSLICVADALLTQKVRALAEQLDSPVNRSGGKFYVYRLQHADAEEVAQILSSVISGQSSSGGTEGSGSSKRSLSNSSRSSSTRTGLDSTTGAAAGEAQAGLNRARSRQSTGSFGAKLNEGEGGKVNLEGEVSVAADTATNSLVINAGKADYEKVKELIDLLDVRRRQVLVEATILEVSLTKNEGVGVEWQTSGGTDEAGVIGQTNFGGISNLLSNPAALSDLTIAAASSGSIVLPGGITLPSQALLVTALSRNQNVNVLSTPTILAIDNQEAEIKVGENVPFVTSTSTNQTNLNNTFNQIERQDVGIKLRITPQISAGDFVVLQIFVEISNVVAGTRNDENGPTTTIRTSETVVEVKSDQMVVTGGLIADSVTDSTRGVPYLQDIPVLGNLFRRDDGERRRNNLLIFITPRIITDQFVAREQTLVKRDKLEQVIDAQQSEPDRHEVLRSDDLDRVVESHPVSPNQPTTVTPPKEARAAAPSDSQVEILATKRTEERLRQLGTGDVPSEADMPSAKAKGDLPQKGEEELEIEVAPKLPGAKTQKPERTSSREYLPSAGSSASLAKSTRFVVLREMSRQNEASPFSRANPAELYGLAVQGADGPEETGFFEVGGRYSFHKNGSQSKYIVLGVYESERDARRIHSSLGSEDSWYTVAEPTLESSGWTAG